ncbi:MAG: NTP transferase domain-containing protein [Bacteroidales bacterium]|nr:NTP transferase domain-containing protein [Bacteroidales bacterium]
MNNDKKNTDTCPAIILSAGLSERMGKPKALLRWSRSASFIEKIINEFCSFNCNPVLCVINKLIEPECRKMKVPASVRFIINDQPESGRFYSVRTGIKEVKESDFCFIHNVDNPFVNRDIIRMLYECRETGAWCSPVYQGRGGHPVLISSSIIRAITDTHDLGTTLADILNSYPRRNVDAADDTILRNINTQEDFNYYLGLPG